MSSNDLIDDTQGLDICRVCRSEGLPDRPLFHPCICTGSIKWIHQECLIQWMRYSRKEYCELCSYRFSFTPIYSPDMPRRLPLRDVISGLLTSVATAVHYWLHTTLVVLAWIGVVPIAACRIYRVLFSGSIQSVLELLSVENVALDMLHGGIVVTCTLLAFIGLVWLREQILHGGALDWVENQGNAQDVNVPPVVGQGVLPPDNNNQHPMNWQDVPEAAAGVDGAGANLGDIPADVDPDAGGLGDPVPPPAEGPNEEPNWNPIEWDRAAEDLTWERLLGLDGSLVFLEHVFWVVSLNTLFILLFAYIPYHVGHGAVVLLGLHEYATAAHFEGLVTTLCGYCAIGIMFVLLQGLASLFGLIRTKRFLRLCYIVVKVSLLTVVELGILPLICGWWLDICSLSMFDATLKDREASFRLAPGTDLFIHWLVGMVYVYYFASFILLLREVLRPGVLWFLRNLNDPDFSPIQEMIHLPILRHIRRLVASVVIFGMAVLLMLWVPVRILRWAWPTFLPYTVALHSDTQVNELSLELLLLQVILPALLEQSHSRIWLKWLVGLWCRFMAWSLDLHSYLLGDEEPQAQTGGGQAGQGGQAHGAAGQQVPPGPGDAQADADGANADADAVAADAPAPEEVAAAAPAAEPVGAQDGGGGGGFAGLGGGGLAAAHLALFQPHAPTGYRPFKRPSLFWVRLLALVLAMCVSLVLASLIALTVPVWVGRRVMNLCLVGTSSSTGSSSGRVHELYTAACGMYLCWLGARAFALMLSWLPQGRAAMIARVKQWFVWSVRAAVAFSVLLGLVPLLFGLLLELVVVVPLRVSLEQSAVLFMWQDWALGVLYTKIACAIAMMGPDWVFRRTIERAYRDGIRNMDLRFILNDLAAPLVFFFGLALSIPYATAHGIVPLFVQSPHLKNLISRRIYPFVLLIGLVAAFVCFQIRQFRKLYNHIKDSKYLVGRRLVNYDPRRHKSTSTRD